VTEVQTHPITKATRLCNIKAIKYTVEKWSPGGDPRAFLTFAKRESNFNHTAVGDNKGRVLEMVKKAWARNKPKLAAAGNPWTDDDALWMGSFGLLQMMAPNHVGRWDEVAHPFCLFHPVINVVTSGRLWNRTIQMGARNLIEARIIWGYGNLKNKGPGSKAYKDREKTTIERLESMGYPSSLAYQSMAAWGLQGFGLRYQGAGELPEPEYDQSEFLWALSQNLGLPPIPPPDMKVPVNWSCKLGKDTPGEDPSTPGDGDAGEDGGTKTPGTKNKKSDPKKGDPKKGGGDLPKVDPKHPTGDDDDDQGDPPESRAGLWLALALVGLGGGALAYAATRDDRPKR
jgi:hypothetical protein